MIVSLNIKNYTLIENLQINFESGYSVITGETGAGKSMLLGALGLILGKRADLSSLKNKEEKCTIEASFNIKSYNLKDFFEQNDIDYEDITIIRREILPSGKSRAFVNDTPTTLQLLEELGGNLMEIHSQHQTRELTEENYQLAFLDILAENNAELKNYKSILTQYKKNQKELENLNNKLAEFTKEKEFNTFIFNELNNANLKIDEQQELEEEYQQLSNVEAIKEVLSKTINLADNENFGIHQNLTEIKNIFSKIASYSENYNNLSERIISLQIEFNDILQEVNALSDGLADDPERTIFLGERLRLLYDLQSKYKVTTTEELIQVRDEAAQKIDSVENLSHSINQLTEQIQQSKNQLDHSAETLHKKRLKAIELFQSKVTPLLSELGMPNAQFNIQLESLQTYTPNGKNQIAFLFSANKGGQFGILKKTASGGEMSRIMFAIKAILAQYYAMPTIIFDEIDTGISGDIAQKMATMMEAMSQKRQVFAITHLPQIASKGKLHYKVYKSTLEEDTVSDLKLLNTEERILEIAEMISGKKPSESALLHAKNLLKQ